MSRQLDKAIAEALGYKVGYSLLEYPEGEDCDYWVDELNVRLPHYSTDGHDMLELDSEMRERGYKIDVALWEEWKVIYWHDNERISAAIADTEPLARALAAYKALTGKEWAEHDRHH